MSHIADSFRQVENAVFCMLLFFSQKWYDTIRDAISTCAEKLTWVSLIYCLEPTTKKWNDASACAINCVSANSVCPNLCVHTMNTNIIGRCMWWLELQMASTPAAVTVLISLPTPRTTILLVDVLWWHLFVIIQEVISWYAGCIVLFAVSSEETSDEPGERPHKRKRGHDNKLVTRVCSNTCVLLIH